MENQSNLDLEYSQIVKNNPDKQFVLYIRTHPDDSKEDLLKKQLSDTFGEYKDLPEQRLSIFITNGKNVLEFIDKLNSSDTSMYLSFIQTVDELEQK